MAVLDPMEVRNHEKRGGMCLRRQLSKLSLEVSRSVYCPNAQAPQTPHSSVISIDFAGSKHQQLGVLHRPRL